MPTPPTLYIKRVSPVMPTPTLVNGHPSPGWVPSSTTIEDFAKPQLLADPRGTPIDLTTYRDTPFDLRSLVLTDPGGDAQLVVAIPNVYGHEAIGTGSLAWVSENTEIQLGCVRPSTAVLVRFQGLIESAEFEDDFTLVLTCIGANFQINDFVRAPGVDKSVYDIGEAMVVKWTSSDPGVRPSLHTDDLVIVSGGVTVASIGISSALRGAWEREWDNFSQLQALSILGGGTDQWTLELLHPWQPRYIKRSERGVVHTISYGTPGFTIRPRKDWSQTFNVIYGYGVNSAGEEWRNLFVGDDGTPHYQPLWYLDAVHGFDEGTGADLGRLVDNSARTDSSIRRRELVINFGEGIGIEEAKAIAAEIGARLQDPGWVATATLNVDVEERSRFEINEGDTLKVKHFDGTGTTGVSFHIGEYNQQQGWDAVDLTLDTKARDLALLEQILNRNRAAASPSRSLRLGRTSGQTNDLTVPWDASNGAGWLPRERAPRFNGGSEGTQTVALTANTWGIFQVPAGEAVSIGLAEFFCSTPAEFAVGVFDWAVDTGHLPTNPLTATTDWSLGLEGCLMAWGWANQPGGYYDPPDGTVKFGDGGARTAASLTGVMKADNVWPISHTRGTPVGSGDTSNSGSPALVWIAAFADTTCDFNGRLSVE